MSADFEIIRLIAGEGIVADTQRFQGQIKPVKLFILPEGDARNKPSYCLLMIDYHGGHWVAQISHQMILDAWAEYKKIPPKHDPKCDIDPSTLQWRHELEKGQIAYVCSACMGQINSLNLNARKGSTAESTAKE